MLRDSAPAGEGATAEAAVVGVVGDVGKVAETAEAEAEWHKMKRKLEAEAAEAANI